MHLLTTSCQHILSSHPVNTQASTASSSSAGSRSQNHPPSLSSLPPPPPPPMVPTAPTAVLSSPRSLMEGVSSFPCPYVTDVYPISGATPSTTLLPSLSPPSPPPHPIPLLINGLALNPSSSSSHPRTLQRSHDGFSCTVVWTWSVWLRCWRTTVRTPRGRT